MSDEITTAEIVRRLHQRYADKKWETAVEVGDGTGWTTRRHLDFVALNTWPSEDALIGFEIKVSRADFLRELADPSKRAPFELAFNELWIVAPAGVAKPEEMPEGIGLMEAVGQGDKLRRKLAAKFYRDREPDRVMWAAIMRALGHEKRQQRAQMDQWAEVRGQAVTIEQLRRMSEKLFGRTPTRAEADPIKFRRKAEARASAWRSDWARAIERLGALAHAEGIEGARRWRAWESPESAKAITAWLETKSNIGKPLQAAERLLQAVDEHIRPILEES